MIVDGKALARERKEGVRVLRVQHDAVTLGVVVSVVDAVTESYVRIKKKVAQDLDIDVVMCESVEEANQHDGVILQLPLAQGMDVDCERNKILPEKDVDVLSDEAFRRFASGESAVVPPVIAAIDYLIKRYDISYQGKHVVVVGNGRLVGKPATVFFNNGGARVTTVERGDDVKQHTRDADIIVLGVGYAGILTPDMIKEGVVIFDAGTSESGGAIKGDADLQCSEKALLFTPVPGGIGPIAVVEIFANLVSLVLKTND